MSVAIQTTRKVWDVDNHACIEIVSNEDCANTLSFRTMDQTSKTWFGDIDIVMTKEYALSLAQALISSANEL